MADPRDYVGTARTGEAAPSPRFRGVSQEAGGPVWILLSVPHPDWEDRLWTEERSQQLHFAPENTQRVTRLIAVDPETGEILARRTLDEQWIRFAGQGVAYSWALDEYGVPYLDLWRPRLVTEPVAP